MADTPDPVERRLRYIRRQIEMEPSAVDVNFRGRKPEITPLLRQLGLAA